MAIVATLLSSGPCTCKSSTARRAWRPSAGPSRARRCSLIAASSAQQRAPDTDCRPAAAASTRRNMLLAGTAALTAGLGLRAGDASARYGNWDMESPAIGSCAIGDEGDECRRNLLMKDRAKSGGSNYGTQLQRSGQLGDAITTGVPVSVLDDEYGRATVALAAVVEKFAALDLYDPERVKVIAEIKKEGSAWVSKYARGGSARKQAARKMYIVVDALQGHFAANGFAPLQPAKLKKVLDNVDEAKKLLAAGR